MQTNPKKAKIIIDKPIPPLRKADGKTMGADPKVEPIKRRTPTVGVINF